MWSFSMKRALLASIASLAIAALTGSVFAAELGRPGYEAPAVYSVDHFTEWTGCYLGGSFGGARSNANYNFDNGSGIVEPFSFDAGSFIGGGQLGCQFEFAPKWVLGAEGTFSSVHLQQTDTSAIFGSGFTRALSIDEIASVTARLGYAWDNWMLYTKGGGAGARVNTHAAATLLADETDWENGWTVGGGLEYVAWHNIVLGVEFNYYRFNFDRTVSVGGVATQFTDGHADIYSGLFRASYLFNFF
jgi:outer membrane immunogenic protein